MLALSCCAACVTAGRAEDPPAAPAAKRINNAANELYKAAGYIAVPMRRTPGTPNFYVDAVYYGNKVTFLVDTGAGADYLDEAKAKFLLWPLKPSAAKSYGFGGSKAVKEALIHGVALGSIELPYKLWKVSDYSELVEMSMKADGIHFDSTLGSGTMIYYSAIIGLPNSTLLLLDPIRQEADLQGEWEVTEDRSKGRLTPLDDRPTRITVKGSKLSMSKDGEKTTKDYYLQLERNATPKAMDWIEDDGKTITASYAIADGVWTLSLPDPTAKAMARPNKLTSEKGDTFTTYKLAKAKPVRLTPQEN